MATLGKTTITDLNVLNGIKENNTSLVDKYTTLGTSQTISGKKTFSNGLNITGGCTENKNMPFFLGIDAFADGGAVKWIDKSNVANAIGAVSKNGDTITGKLTVTTNGISIGGTDNAASASLDFLRGTYNYISSPSGSNIGIQPGGLSKTSTTGYKFDATSFFPGVTNTYNLGTSTLQWKSVRGVTLYENGTSLVDKYEPKINWYTITPYTYQNNIIYHHYTKIATIQDGMDHVLRFRIFEDVNYPSYGEYVVRINHNTSYGQCVSLNQVSTSTRNFYVYVSSEVVDTETKYYVWILSDIEWTSSIQFKIEKGSADKIVTSNWEQSLTEPSDIIYTMINNGSCRIRHESDGTISFTNDQTTDTCRNHLTANKFIKSHSNDNFVLLGGGGHKSVSDFAASSHTHSYLPLSGGTLTNDLSILTGDSDKFINYIYSSASPIGASWRIGSAGSGTGDTNYFKIQSGTSSSTTSTWYDVVKFGQNTFDATFAGNILPSTNNAKSIGSSSLKWANVYATTFNGDLTGNATTATTASKVNMTSGTADAWRNILCSNGSNGVCYEGNGYIQMNYSKGAMKAKSLYITGSNSSTGYITADTSDNMYFVLNNSTPLTLTSTVVRPGLSYNNKVDLGTSTTKWKNVYATTFNGDLAGNATSASKLNLSAQVGGQYRPVYFKSDGTPSEITGIVDLSIVWNSASSNSNLANISPLDTAASSQHSANRLAFANPAGITVEYSTDGTNWIDYGLTDAQKIGFVSDIDCGMKAGKGLSTKATANDKLRITFNAQSMGVYTMPKSLLIYMSTNGSVYNNENKVRLDVETAGSDGVFKSYVTNCSVAGWSGWNKLPLTGIRFGGGLSDRKDKIRLTFSSSGAGSSYTSGAHFTVNKFVMIGEPAWGYPSAMALNGHLYGWKYDQTMTLPSGLEAKNIIASQPITLSGTTKETSRLIFSRSGSEGYNYINWPGNSSTSNVLAFGYSNSSDASYYYMSSEALYPQVNKAKNLGKSDKQWNNIYGNVIYENGTSLANKYQAKGNYIPTSEKVDATDVSHTNWSTNGTYVPTMNFLSYWNGAYNSSGNSNLSHCNKGAFGTAATKDTGYFATASHTHSFTGTAHKHTITPSGTITASGSVDGNGVLTITHSFTGTTSQSTSSVTATGSVS